MSIFNKGVNTRIPGRLYSFNEGGTPFNCTLRLKPYKYIYVYLFGLRFSMNIGK